MKWKFRKSLAHSSKLLSALTIAVCTLISPNTQAVQFGGIVPGMSTIDMPVKSVRELKFTNMIPQSFDFSCGAAALATLLKYGFHEPVTETSVLKGLLTYGDAAKIRKYGFSLLDIKKYVNAHGYSANGYRITVDQLAKLRVPAIVLLDIKGYKHFVVLEKLDGDTVFIADPALGNRAMNKEDFAKSWNNILLVVMNQNFDPNTTLLHPQPPVSDHSLFQLTAPSNVQQLDYGPFKNRFF